MKTSILAAALIAFTGPALALIPPFQEHHPGDTPSSQQAQFNAPAQPQTPAPMETQMPMTQMMQGRMMGESMMQGQSMRGGMMMGRLSPDDMSAFVEAHIAAIHAGLKLSAEQEKLWPPVEEAMRSLARLHLSHIQAMRQTRGMMANDPVGLLRGMADRMSQGADAIRKLTDAAAPLYATLDEAQKRRLQVLMRMGSRGMMGGMMNRRMMGPAGGAMMRNWFSDDDSGDDDGDDQDHR